MIYCTVLYSTILYYTIPEAPGHHDVHPRHGHRLQAHQQPAEVAVHPDPRPGAGPKEQMDSGISYPPFSIPPFLFWQIVLFDFSGSRSSSLSPCHVRDLRNYISPKPPATRWYLDPADMCGRFYRFSVSVNFGEISHGPRNSTPQTQIYRFRCF